MQNERVARNYGVARMRCIAMKRHLFIFLFIGTLLAAGALVFGVASQTRAPQKARIKIGETIFSVEVAQTAAQQMRGLSGHAPLKADEGMLFVFPQKSVQGFWMKDMLFPIDIIWIADGRVVFMERNLPPDDSPNRTIYYPNQAVDAVLEVAAGTADRFNINVGDVVQRRV